MSTGDARVSGAAWPAPLRKLRSACVLAVRAGRRARARVVNTARKQAKRIGRPLARGRKKIRRRVEHAGRAAVNLSRLTIRRVWNVRRPVIRLWKRGARMEAQLATVGRDLGVTFRLRRTVTARGPLIVGPWTSEVGFEVLYWIPFLRWVRSQYDLDPSQITAVSRGGVAPWYAGIAESYVEIFDHLSPAAFAAKNEARRSRLDDTTHKQLELSALDREILDAVRERMGAPRAQVCHPSFMYTLFREFWLGRRSLGFVEDRVRLARLEVPRTYDLGRLPERYVAVKLYTAASLRATPGTRDLLAAMVAALAERTHVVLLDTGLRVDDHDDYVFDPGPRVTNLAGLLTPQNNLGLQTQVIAGATAFIATCGSLAWLAPMLGVDTVALLSDARFLRPHLYFARKAYAELGAGSFAVVDLAAVRHLGIGGFREQVLGSRF